MESQEMRAVIHAQPEQILTSLEVNKHIQLEAEKIDSMFLVGMGGSALPGDLLNALSVTKVPLNVRRSYGLPQFTSKSSMLIASSYSGTTEETLSAYEEARIKGIPIFGSASGNTLEEWCLRDNVPFSKIDFPGMQPRHTFLAAFSGIARVLESSNLISGVVNDLRRIAQVIKDRLGEYEKIGQEVAKRITQKTPVFYASQKLAFAALNMKIQTNENAKTPAFWNFFPELNHNEMIGFTKPQAKFHIVILKDKGDDPRIQMRMDITKEIYAKQGIETSVINVEGETLLEKIILQVVIGLWMSHYLAAIYEVDPIPVEAVEEFKQELKSRSRKA